MYVCVPPPFANTPSCRSTMHYFLGALFALGQIYACEKEKTPGYQNGFFKCLCRDCTYYPRQFVFLVWLSFFFTSKPPNHPVFMWLLSPQLVDGPRLVRDYAQS